jgi:hypothetical protein
MTQKLPDTFIWTKMGAESGEALKAIIKRKELERQLGDGIFAWGIGNSLGNAVIKLQENSKTKDRVAVVFSSMISRPQRIDTDPDSVVLWTKYEDGQQVLDLPEHIVVTSRGHAGSNKKTKHYALLCSQPDRSLLEPVDFESVDPNLYLNFASGNPLGSSQVTSVVKRRDGIRLGQKCYPVKFIAYTHQLGFIKLANPKELTRSQINYMQSAAVSDPMTWNNFIKEIRTTT